MKKSQYETPDYGNWVSTKFVYIPAILGLILLGLAVLLPVLGVLSGLFLMVAAYFAYARYLFAPGGKNIQEKIRTLVLEHLEWGGFGQLLDIGCGSGALTIEMAKKYPKASFTGIDHWGKGWDYSPTVCVRNAQIEGVDQRVTFQKASASNLPFLDESFDAVVSNLVFHEVSGTIDKRLLLQEALRVVKKGGRFVFQDLFLIEQMYGKKGDLLQAIRSWGIDQVEFIETRHALFIPPALKLPFMTGTMGMLVGMK
ncbi:MAG: class I SAM-dependent methyltransferase [Anaerolineales bacterium]|nr:class I SAM-dependent methyltransferase [Anaerolineales bacterium]